MNHMELEIKNLSYGYNNKLLFRDVSLLLRSGDILTILGINGVGKSTLVKCIMQFIDNYKGMISVDGIILKDIPIRKRAKIIGYVAANDIADYDITVLDYISLGFASEVKYLSCPTDKQYKTVIELCKQYNFENLLNRKIKRLSQGERQMTSILRVLLQNPDIVVFDEPTAALDLRNQKELIKLLILLKKQGKIVIQISHNPNHVFQVGGKVLLLFQDKTVYGNVNDVITSESLSKLYGTDISIVTINDKKVIFS